MSVRGPRFLLAGLAFSSVVLVFGAVVGGLGLSREQIWVTGETNLPASVFSRDTSGALQVAPVAPQLISEVAAPSPAALSPAAPGAAPPKKRTSLTASATEVRPPPAAKVASFSLELSAKTRRQGKDSTLITYEAVVRNTGSTTIRDALFRAHVPSGTQWGPDPECTNGGAAVTIDFDGTPGQAICSGSAGPIMGSSDDALHSISLVIPQELAPGSLTRLVFRIVVTDPSLGEVTNHVHLDVAGVAPASASTRTTLR